MCKSVLSKRPRTGAARLFFTVAAAAVVSALVLVGCGGNKGNPASGGGKEYTLTIGIDPDTGGSTVWLESRKKEYRNGDTVRVAAGDTVIVEAWQGSKHKFIGWSGALTSAENPAIIKMDGNKKITARFQRYYTLEVRKNVTNGGTVVYDSSKTEYAFGDVVTVVAAAASGYTFTGWAGASTATTDTVTVTMDGDKTLTANFLLEKYTLTATAAAGGSVFRAPDSTAYAHGTKVTVTATADAGYVFTGWSGTLTSKTNPLIITMNGNETITANFELIPEGHHTLTTTSTIGGSVSRLLDKSTYPNGEEVTLTATADAGYEFTGWSGSSTSTQNPLTIRMDGDKTITANFRLKTYTLNAAATTGGSVSRVPDSTTYAHGTTVTLTAKADSGYIFTGWSGAGTSAPTENPLTITMDGNKTITANFELIPEGYYTLNVNKIPTDGGAVSWIPDTIIYKGETTVKLTATAHVGYEFTGWSGASESENDTVTITMDDNKTITANFKQKEYTLTIVIEPVAGGAVSPDKTAVAYKHGEVVTLTATANAGYKFVNWSGASNSIVNSVPITMDGHKTIVANFSPDDCTTNPSAQGCPGYCPANPTAPGCVVDQCATNPGPTCPNYCQVNPNVPECASECTVTMPGCAVYCEVHPEDVANCPNFCPSTTPGCPGYNPCVDDLTGPECGSGTTKKCRWNNDPDNCYGIGGPYDDTKTEAECIASSGEVVANCNDASTLQYCRWGTSCYPLTNPNGIDPEANGNLTYLQNCLQNSDPQQAFNSQAACEAWTSTGPDYYCYWGGTTGCAKIQNPNALATGKNITNLENCEQNSQPEQSFPTLAACQEWTPPSVLEFCYWGDCEEPTDDGYGCKRGGCYIKKSSDTCTGTNLVTSCPAESKPPNADY
jgi:uncharacterized repeat protein (TIGR02543 family)